MATTPTSTTLDTGRKPKSFSLLSAFFAISTSALLVNLFIPTKLYAQEVQADEESRNLATASVTDGAAIISRRPFNALAVSPKSFRISGELALIRILGESDSGTLQRIEDRFSVIPHPMLSLEYSTGSSQQNFGFMYMPIGALVENANINYLAARYSFDTFISKSMLVGLRLTYSTIAADRSRVSVNGPSNDKFDATGSGGQLSIGWQSANHGFNPYLGGGVQSIGASYLSPASFINESQNISVGYALFGVSSCGNKDRRACLTIEVHQEPILGTFAVFNFSVK